MTSFSHRYHERRMCIDHQDALKEAVLVMKYIKGYFTRIIRLVTTVFTSSATSNLSLAVARSCSHFIHAKSNKTCNDSRHSADYSSCYHMDQERGTCVFSSRHSSRHNPYSWSWLVILICGNQRGRRFRKRMGTTGRNTWSSERLVRRMGTRLCHRDTHRCNRRGSRRRFRWYMVNCRRTTRRFRRIM